MTEFVHLHNHTDYSLLDGAASAAKYVAKAKELGIKALAITDHGNMFGVLEFYEACRKAGIQPIPGCEFYICPESRQLRDNQHKYYHLILLAMNNKGYHNLMELNSIAWTEGFYYKPRIDEESLFAHSEGLICFSACLAGEVPQKLLSSYPDEAYEVAKKYKEHFGDRYYIELQNHFLPDEERVLPMLAKLASDLDIPVVATNDIHYIDKEDANAHDILLCIGTNSKKADTDRMRFETEEFYMKSPEEMAQLFAAYPDAVSNTVKIAQRCNFEIEFPGPELPEVDVPEPYRSTAEYITSLAWEGLARRYPDFDKAPEIGTVPGVETASDSGEASGLDKAPDNKSLDNKAPDGNKAPDIQKAPDRGDILKHRLEYELDVIVRMGFDSYYLIVRDYICWAKDHGIPVGAGRGSGAGSLVAYCLDITDVDPISHDLLFERFLNPERVSLPDFDVDFCFEGRQDVINYVTEKYGKDRVGQIATFGTLKAKNVMKDVARVLDIPFEEANSFTRHIQDISLPDEAKKAGYTSLLKWSVDNSPELQELRSRGGVYEELFDVSFRLENLARHVSTHACGVVIGRKPLKEYVPLYMDPKTKMISTQYTMGVLEQCGLVKMDFLGLKTLTLLRNTERLIKKTDPSFELDKIPDGDAETYAMMARGDSTMVFQFESPGMQKNLKLLEPSKFEELDAMTSLYRPGPMQFIPQYIDSKHGRHAIVYPDPALKELLEPTYGVIVYQEQVMKVAQIIAGFTLGEADILRKIMGKKKKNLLPEQEKKFIAGAVKNGHTEQHAKEIFDMLAPFAGYGFNKSHSVCYTVLSYRTAYLKAHYPAEFYAANLTNEIASGEKFKEYIDYVRGRGIRILPPDINNSDMYFNVVDGDIVYGLVGVKGLGAGSVELILREREENGPYKDFMDFMRRSDPRVLSSTVIEKLINSGSFDCFGLNRPTMLANADDAVKFAQADRDDRMVGQNLLFGADDGGTGEFEIRPVQDYDFMQKLDFEKQYIGFYLSGHPLDACRASWENCVRLDLGHPERIRTGIKYDLIGMITDVRALTTKSGTRMGKVVIEDYNGKLEITIFAKQWAMYEAALATGRIMGFHGSFNEYQGNYGFVADVIYGDPAQMKPTKPHRVHVMLDRSAGTRDGIKEMKKTCAKHRGIAELEFSVYSGTDESGNAEGLEKRILADTEFNVDATRELVFSLKECQGVLEAYAD